MDIVYPLNDTDNYDGSILNAVVRYLSRYEGYDDYLADALSSSDEGITREIQNALHQLILNQAVTALKNGIDEMLDVLYEDTNHAPQIFSTRNMERTNFVRPLNPSLQKNGYRFLLTQKEAKITLALCVIFPPDIQLCIIMELGDQKIVKTAKNRIISEISKYCLDFFDKMVYNVIM